MQLDIYRRPEPQAKFSYLAVPSGRPIPEEAVSAEWAVHARTVELDEDSGSFEQYGIDAPATQLREKGYAITSLAHQVEASR